VDGIVALRARTGRIWWQRAVRAAFGSAPIAYMVRGREYLVIVSGGAAVTLQDHLGLVGHTLFGFALK
jgi:glucose dehydrogenase